jgi:hypothetical protein
MNRNDPCWCGSGRKFKKCHGGAAAPVLGDDQLSITRRSELARASACKTLDLELRDDLFRFARKRFGPDWAMMSARAFSMEDSPELDETEGMLLFAWSLFHMSASDDEVMPLAWVWRESQRVSRVSEKARLVQAHLDAPIGIWEVQSVERGVGTQLKDLLSGTERFVYDAESSKLLERGLAIVGYVVDCDGISFFGGIHFQPLLPLEASVAVKAVRKLARVRTKPVPHDFLTDQFRQLDVIDEWRLACDDVAIALKRRTMVNHDGDEIAPQSDRFDLVGARAAVREQLATIPGTQEPTREGIGSSARELFVVERAPKKSDTVMDSVIIGTLVLTDTTLTVESNSVSRANELRAHVERACGTAVQFRLRSSESMEAMLDRAQQPAADASSPAASGPPSGKFYTNDSPDMPPEVREAIQRLMAKHNATWPDIPVPALGNVAPRRAAKDPKLRPRLIALLNDMEARQAIAKQGVGMGMDFAALRKDLGVERD